MATAVVDINKNRDAVKDNEVKNKTAKGRMDSTLLVLTLGLVTIGLVMVFSASFYFAKHNYGDSFHFIYRQSIFAVLGVAAMLIISHIHYNILKKLVYWIVGISIALMIVVLFMPTIKGVRRWIVVGGVGNFQPSEVAKFAIIVLFAFLIAANYKKMGTFSYGVLPFITILGVFAGLMILQPHISGTVLIMAIGLLMMYIGGTKYRYFVFALVVVAALVVGLVLFKGIDYVQARLTSWTDPFSDITNTTHQSYQSLLTIGSGGFFGVGLGNSQQKWLYLPEPQNDFIFSVVCEELGFLGAAIIVILFMFFVFRGFVIASKAPDKFGMMLTVGIIGQIGIQTLLNIAVVTNSIPNTGISLPFFSYGGTALLMQLAQIGIVLNISRHARMNMNN